MVYKLYAVIKDFSKELEDNNINAHASSAAYFMFLSVIPILLLVCSILPFTSLTEANLMQALDDMLPAVLSPLALSIVAEVYDRSIAVVSITAIVTVWSAAKGILAIMRALNTINRVDETRNYILLRLRASVYTVLLLVMIVLSMSIMVYGNVLVQIILRYVPQLRYFMEFVMAFRFMYGWIILTLIFALMYAGIPNKKMKIRMQLPGAAFSGIAWSVFSWGFSLYVNNFGDFGMYGSLTAVVLMMLWLYICMYLLMIGAEINLYFKPVMRYYFNRRDKKRKLEERSRKN